MKRLLLIRLLFMAFTSIIPLSARLTVNPPSREWDESISLQHILTESFGEEEPFSSYLATMYFLDKLEERLTTETKKAGRAILEETHCLLDALGLTTHALLTPVISDDEDREGEVYLDKSNDHIITLYLLLKRAEGHLARKLPHYFEREELTNDETLQQLGQQPPPYVQHPEQYPEHHEKPNKFVSLLKKTLPPIFAIGIPLIILKYYFVDRLEPRVKKCNKAFKDAIARDNKDHEEIGSQLGHYMTSNEETITAIRKDVEKIKKEVSGLTQTAMKATKTVGEMVKEKNALKDSSGFKVTINQYREQGKALNVLASQVAQLNTAIESLNE